MLLNVGCPTRPATTVAVVVVVVELEFVRFNEVGNVEKAALLETDIHKRGLHAWKHGFHAAEIDVSDNAIQLWSIDQYFYEVVILQDSYTRLAWAGGRYEYFPFQRYSPAP